jgi:hypothetical protein
LNGIAPYQPSSETSKEAAQKIEPARRSMRREVYVTILRFPISGFTRKELEGITGLLTQTLCARLNELEKANRIRKAIDLSGNIVKRGGCAVYIPVLQGPYLD